MYGSDPSEMKELKMKVQQHEETIAQLVEIIAATNRQVSDLHHSQFANTNQFSLTSVFSPK